MPTLEMAVDRLRQGVYFVGAGIKSGVEDEILKAIAAVLVKAQIADGRAAVEGIPDELRAAVLQELAVVAVGGQVTGRARRRKAAKSSVCKINIDSDSRLAMTAAIRKTFAEKPAEFDPRKYLGPARDNMEKLYKHKIINVLGSNDKL